MIVILKHEARQEQIDRLKQFLLGMGLRIDESKGENSTILGLVGDTTRVDADLIFLAGCSGGCPPRSGTLQESKP